MKTVSEIIKDAKKLKKEGNFNEAVKILIAAMNDPAIKINEVEEIVDLNQQEADKIIVNRIGEEKTYLL
jgi:hypothetical protein